MMAEEQELLKMLWAYMLQEGLPTDGEWSYYGGHFECVDKEMQYHADRQETWRKRFMQYVRDAGVDWQKTQPPEYESRQAFVGTDNDSEPCNSLLGELHLLDGSSHKIGVGDAEQAFRDLRETLKTMAKVRGMVRNVFPD